MAYRSFRSFLDALEKAGDLKRIAVPVDTDLLIAEWADREMKSPGGGKALLFEQPIVDGKKSEFAVAINTMGSRRRMAMALQVEDIEDVAREIQLMLKAKPPTDLREGWNLLKQGIHLLHARPKSVHDAPCQEVVHRVEHGDCSLEELPILNCWPNELLFAGFLRRKSVELVRCKTIDLEVPADVDFVLEGFVQPGELRPEGPFGDHTGYYTAIEDYPAFHLTAITHRRDAVYPTTIVGIPPMEDYYIGEACVRIFLPVFKMNFPELVDMALPPEGVFHNLVFISIRKQYPYQAFKVMHGLWGMGQMMFSKYIVAVDEDCDVHNTSEVLFRLCANTDPARDTTVIKNPSDSLDHAPSEQNIGSHMGFDAT